MSEKKFAKLFEDENIGQILVKIDSCDEDEYKAEVRIYFKPEGFGVCSVTNSYKSWELAEQEFEKTDLERCLNNIIPVLEQFQSLGGSFV